MAVKQFALPDLGEGLTESELVSWHVAVGDTVTLNQPIAEVETAKALVELPSPFAGVITALLAEPGTTVLVGAPILQIKVEGEEPDAAAAVAADAPAEREPVLVGYGPKVEGGAKPTRRARKGRAGVEPEAGTASGAGVASEGEKSPSPYGSSARLETSAAKERTRSTPPVRKLARDLGVDLESLTGTGADGLVTREDVERAAAGGAPKAAGIPAARAVPSATVQGDVTRIPVAGVRKHTAAAMVQSAFTAPHASEFLTIDVTETLELIDSLRELPAFRGIRLNLLGILAKAMCLAIVRTPEVNARWDEQAQEIIQYHYVNLGIAAATPRGLMVPNIKNAHALDLAGVAQELSSLVATAKEGKSSPAELSGGTISITNIGVFGIDAGTPILPPGEALILALGAVRRLPWEHRGEIALRSILTLSISFDHRLVDGEQASRFLADVGAILSKPAALLAMV
ncbi:MAG: 2-oxo acid dehydrogenase subunit E2 [Cryobacterium sp.]|nr:2-oxo acid dehydrogenase subunit E2 [Cryobacterium sp.]